MEFTRGFKLFVIGLVVFITTFLLAVYINTYIYRSKAADNTTPRTTPGATTPALLTPTTSPAGGIKAHFSPLSGKAAIGEQISTNFIVDGFSASQKVSSFDVKMQVADGVDVIGFSSGTSVPQPTSGTTPPAGTTPGVTPGTTAGGNTRPVDTSVSDATSGCTTVIKSWDSTSRIARISQLCRSATLLDSVLVPLSLKGTKNATGKISITDIEVVGPQASNGYAVSKDFFSFQIGAGGTEPSPSGVPSSAGKVQLLLSVRLQGIQAKPKQSGSLQFKVGAISKSMDAPIFQSAGFTPDDNGIYRGSLAIDVPAGDGYSILVKGPLHLQKKLCDGKPSESFPGTYTCDKGNISLKNGDNSFDFTGVYMMSCDLPVQNGICNSADMVLIRNNLGTTDAGILQAADINRDGAVNGHDYALAIASFSIKTDDR